jgi:hypothetical protein
MHWNFMIVVVRRLIVDCEIPSILAHPRQRQRSDSYRHAGQASMAAGLARTMSGALIMRSSRISGRILSTVHVRDSGAER